MAALLSPYGVWDDPWQYNSREPLDYVFPCLVLFVWAPSTICLGGIAIFYNYPPVIMYYVLQMDQLIQRLTERTQPANKTIVPKVVKHNTLGHIFQWYALKRWWWAMNALTILIGWAVLGKYLVWTYPAATCYNPTAVCLSAVSTIARWTNYYSFRTKTVRKVTSLYSVVSTIAWCAFVSRCNHVQALGLKCYSTWFSLFLLSIWNNFSHACVCRISGVIYIPYCQCEMLLELLACLMHLNVLGDAIRTLLSIW